MRFCIDRLCRKSGFKFICQNYIKLLFQKCSFLFDHIIDCYNVKRTERGFCCSWVQVVLHGQKHDHSIDCEWLNDAFIHLLYTYNVTTMLLLQCVLISIPVGSYLQYLRRSIRVPNKVPRFLQVPGNAGVRLADFQSSVIRGFVTLRSFVNFIPLP